MSTLFVALAAITTLFLTLLAVKNASRLRYCVMCAGVSLTWIGLLAASRLGVAVDPTIVALLVGQSVVGTYYLAERRLPERFHIFRLPFLLTMTAAAAALLGALTATASVLLLLVAAWAAFGFVFAYRQDARVRAFAGRVVACCRDW